MKKLLKIVLGIFIALILLICAALYYVKAVLPKVNPAPNITVKKDPVSIARGAYLANNVTLCIDCHSTRDWTKYAGPPIESTFGKGGELFDQKFGFPGKYISKNITPAGISRYTDGELYRVITTGVTKEGKALFPVMPYQHYGLMDDEDIYSIIAYIRSLAPIENKVEASVSDFPMNFIINTIPINGAPSKRPLTSDSVQYGKYLVNAAACIDCHTKFEKGMPIPGTEFGGGREFPFPTGALVRSKNITPDNETGIGNMTAEAFVQLFRDRASLALDGPPLQPGQINTLMPWSMYGKMTESDLRSIYQYLKTVKPIKNQVVVYQQ